MKKTLAKLTLMLCIAFGVFFSFTSISQAYYTRCWWVGGPFPHRVCRTWGGPYYNHWRRCGWRGGYWRFGYWHPAYRVCW